ncbi:MAG: hypothetical protein U1F35_16010 [Steroidobacteraceae bacterium]
MASTVGAVGAFCVIQDIVPAQFRATGIALLTFTNTLVGLGLGPTLVGAASDTLFQSQSAVDGAITSVAAPAAVAAALLLAVARRREQASVPDRLTNRSRLPRTKDAPDPLTWTYDSGAGNHMLR